MFADDVLPTCAAVDRDDFRDVDDPGYAKAVYEPDEHARHWFRRSWTLGVGSSAHVLVNGVLEQAREYAEPGRAA